METLKVDRTKLITQAAYAKKNKMSRQLVNQMVKDKRLTSLVIDGAVLIYLG